MIKFLKTLAYSMMLVNCSDVCASQNEREEEARQSSQKSYNNSVKPKNLPNDSDLYPYASGGYHYEGEDSRKGAAIFTKKTTENFWQRLQTILYGGH